MTARKPFTLIAAAIFGLMALVHIYRLAIDIPIHIGNTVVGPALSWVALVVAGCHCVGLLRESRG